MPELLDLVEQVLEARTGEAADNPGLAPLGESADPLITTASDAVLTEMVGEWDFPPGLLGLDAFTKVAVTASDGHLVGYTPVSGTFRLYLQDDGTLHQEDSYDRYVAVRDSDGSFVGIADVGTIAIAAITAASQGLERRAQFALSMVEDDESVRVGVARGVVALLDGRREVADRLIRQLAQGSQAIQTEAEVNGVGYALMQNGDLELALQVFELNTRVFPEASNTWDSLGEALMNLGRGEEAVRAYERSLELDPNNANARTMIDRIRQPDPTRDLSSRRR